MLFSRYYTSEPVLLVKKDSAYAKRQTLDDFKDAKSLNKGALPYDLISSNSRRKKRNCYDYSNASLLKLQVIDAYVSERPEALTAESANVKFKMIQPEPGF